MADMYDAVNWRNLLPFSGPVMGYQDGVVSQWPADAWAHFADRVTLRITVLADERCQVFDAEYGNAPQAQVATAVANRLQSRLWSTVYSAQGSLPVMTQALRSKGLHWTDAQYWPKPAVYLHVADPSGNIRAGRWQPPVTPVAVQDRWYAGYDVSSCYGSYPVMPAPNPPPAPPGPVPSHQAKEVNMIVAVATGDAVGTVSPGQEYLVFDIAEKYIIEWGTDQQALRAILPVANLSCAFLHNIGNMP